MTTVERPVVPCPDWCGGDDHYNPDLLADGIPPGHFRSVASDIRSGEVIITKPVDPGRTTITLGGPDCGETKMEPYIARALAALLVRAADEAEFRP